MRADIGQKILQQLQWISGGRVGSKTGVWIVEVRVGDLARVSMGGGSWTLDFGTASDLVDELHGDDGVQWCLLVCIPPPVQVWGWRAMTSDGHG